MMLSAGQAYLNSFPLVLPFPIPPRGERAQGLPYSLAVGTPWALRTPWTCGACFSIDTQPRLLLGQTANSSPAASPSWTLPGPLKQPSKEPSRYCVVSLGLVHMEADGVWTPKDCPRRRGEHGPCAPSCFWPRSPTPGGTGVHPFGRRGQGKRTAVQPPFRASVTPSVKWV